MSNKIKEKMKVESDDYKLALLKKKEREIENLKEANRLLKKRLILKLKEYNIDVSNLENNGEDNK